jgi:hypothetical protein
MQLKYVGQTPTNFRDTELPNGALVRVGYVQPGDEFSVPDEAAERYLRRADIVEAAQDEKPAKGRQKAAQAAAEATPEAPAADVAEAPADAAPGA